MNLLQRVQAGGIDDRYMPHAQDQHLRCSFYNFEHVAELAGRPEEERTIHFIDLHAGGNLPFAYRTRVAVGVAVPVVTWVSQGAIDSADSRHICHALHEEERSEH